MLIKLVLAVLSLLAIAAAIHFDPARTRTLLGSQSHGGARLRLLTWNIGYADLEDDSRAHTKDLNAVAETILNNDPDAVTLQELTGAEQLNLLLKYLHNRYRGSVAPSGNGDRVEAVLVKAPDVQFEAFPSAERRSVAATFHVQDHSQAIVIVSAHADAFNAARRRIFTGDVVDWARNRPGGSLVFIGGDFNFELKAKDQSQLYTDNVKNDGEAYSYALKYFRDLGRDAGYTAIDDRRIDYLFGPSESVVRRAEVLRNSSAGKMDHWPVLVEISL